MHSIKVSVRLIALLTVAIVAVLAFASLSPGTQRETAHAGGGPVTVIPPSVICTDFWLGTKDLDDVDRLRVAASISRIEAIQDGDPGYPDDSLYNVITALYIGPDQKPWDESTPAIDPDGILDLIPDVPPTRELCQKDYDDGVAGAEANQMRSEQDFEARSNNRPGTQVGFPAVLTQVGSESHLIYSTCTFDEANKQWVRIDTDLNIIATTPGSKSTPAAGEFGEVVATLYLGTDAPTTTKDTDGDTTPDVAIDPSECAEGSATSFNTQADTIFRHVRTDFTGAAKNSGLAADTDTGTSADSADGVADDWDGDGCTDWDELDKNFAAGRDPFNPNDCDLTDITNSYSFNGTLEAATDDTAGTYFHCLAAIEQSGTDLTGAMQCYLGDLNPALTGGPKDAIPSKGDGNPGAPPPPPYTIYEPAAINGTLSGGRILLSGCLGNRGGALAPNIIIDIDIDVDSLKGGANVGGGGFDIYGMQTQAACGNKTFNDSTGVTHLAGELVAIRQGINQNHDKDKCTDMEELLGTGPATCGDDPYNPHDSDQNFNLIGNIMVTVNQALGEAGWDKGDGEIIPGAYYTCITDIQHTKTETVGDVEDLEARIFCYTDTLSPFGVVNPEADAVTKGDGIAGGVPPYPNQGTDINGTFAYGLWADHQDNVTILDGTYDPTSGTYGTSGTLVISGCFADKDGFGAQDNVYVTATVNAATGTGTAEIRLLISDTGDCQNGAPFDDGVGLPTSRIQLVEQGNKEGKGAYQDTDRDGCSDKEELGDNPVFGGLRDPYNYWDFFDPNKDGSIGFGDFLAVLSRAGSVDFNGTAVINRWTNPLTEPPAAPPATYHPRFDRSGVAPGTPPAGWHEMPPNGNIGFGDFLSLVRSSGMTCLGPPNDPKFPYTIEE